LNPPPSLTVIIPTRGRHRLLSRVIDRLEAQTGAPNFEVVVVADALEEDVDAVTEAVERTRLDSRVLQADRPGASAARNRGWRAARAPIILFIGDDTLPERRLLAEHYGWHQRHPEEHVAILGLVRWADEIRVTPFMSWLDEGIQFGYGLMRDTEAGWGRFYTANASLKRSLIERVGGFDEDRLPFLYEDLDLAYRLRPYGFRLLYNPAAVTEHVHPMTVEQWKSRAARVAVAEREFVRLHPDVPPYFYNLFSGAARSPRPRGLGARLVGVVPRWTPVIGKRVWRSADAVWRHALAEPFMAAWEREPASPPGGA
jgi:GT2 family glycosyltransferase